MELEREDYKLLSEDFLKLGFYFLNLNDLPLKGRDDLVDLDFPPGQKIKVVYRAVAPTDKLKRAIYKSIKVTYKQLDAWLDKNGVDKSNVHYNLRMASERSYEVEVLATHAVKFRVPEKLDDPFWLQALKRLQKANNRQQGESDGIRERNKAR